MLPREVCYKKGKFDVITVQRFLRSVARHILLKTNSYSCRGRGAAALINVRVGWLVGFR